MGLTRGEATALGLGHLFPTRSDAEVLRRLGVSDVVPSEEDLEWPTKDLSGKPPPLKKQPGDGMNKLERSFAQTLGEGILKPPYHRWAREPIKVRLAGRTWFTPDFAVWFPYTADTISGRFTLIEVKGFMRDDASVKLKVAADLYPEWRWLLVRRAGRHGWGVREVGRTGIGTHDIVVPWISGGET